VESEIVHFEIPAKDPKKLSAFYSKCFGWKFEDAGMQGMKYWIITTSAKAKWKGGMYKKGKSSQVPVNYIGTKNIDATMKSIKKAGGSILMGKQEIPHMGWSAMTKDPEGNVLGLFQPSMGMPKQTKSKRK